MLVTVFAMRTTLAGGPQREFTAGHDSLTPGADQLRYQRGDRMQLVKTISGVSLTPPRWIKILQTPSSASPFIEVHFVYPH